MKDLTMVWTCPAEFIEKVLNSRPYEQANYYPIVEFISKEDLLEEVYSDNLFLSIGEV